METTRNKRTRILFRVTGVSLPPVLCILSNGSVLRGPQPVVVRLVQRIVLGSVINAHIRELVEADLLTTASIERGGRETRISLIGF